METKKVNQKNQAREELKFKSKTLKPLIDRGVHQSVNEAIIASFKKENPQVTELKGFWQWKKEGKKIIKGAKGLAVWGKPIKVKSKEAQEEKFEMFPVSFLFSNLQVH